jgi:WD40 repeat protein
MPAFVPVLYDTACHLSAAISDDGTTVASVSEDATIKLWRLPEATCVTTFTGDSEMYTLAMTPDATLIAAGERGGCLHLLQVTGLLCTPNFDLASDGKRFVVLMPAEGPEPRETQSHVTLAVNFFDEVRRRVAVQGK